MGKKIVIDGLSQKNLDSAVKELREYQKWVRRKEKELRLRLATLGATVASIQFSRAIYTGKKDVTVRVDNTGSVAVIYAEGESVVFIEFGAGAKDEYRHPQGGEFGFVPGSWSDGPEGKGHWDDENGWWIPKESGGGHTWGHPPAMAMYEAVQRMTEEITTIAREVFST